MEEEPGGEGSVGKSISENSGTMSVMDSQMYKESIIVEKKAFDEQAEEREKYGLYPDIRDLRVVEKLYNNPWREPEFFHLQILPRIEFILNAITNNKGKVLEVGCGNGFLSLEMARFGMDVCGIDISTKSIEIARKTAKNNKYADGFGSLKYEVADFMSAEFVNSSWDSVVFMGALHHFPDIDKVVKKVVTLLKPKGNIVLCEPVSDNFTRPLAEIAALLRLVCPTWQSYQDKLEKVQDAKSWEKYVDEIMHEYQYLDVHGNNVQSPMDNVTNVEEDIINSVNKYFEISRYVKTDAFIDKLIGGLRGPDRYPLAKFLKLFDDYVINNGKLPHTGIRVHGIKR